MALNFGQSALPWAEARATLGSPLFYSHALVPQSAHSKQPACRMRFAEPHMEHLDISRYSSSEIYFLNTRSIALLKAVTSPSHLDS